MNYLIFSDECGTWKAGDYYIRSWIKISPEDYELISKDIVYIKYTVIHSIKTSTNNIKK